MKDILQFKDLKGKIIQNITIHDSKEEVFLTISDTEKYLLYHNQDCCEAVWLEEVVGDLEDLLHTPIIRAEEIEEIIQDDLDGLEKYTFYHISTIKGSVTLRWCGQSNGYYSVSVDIKRIGD